MPTHEVFQINLGKIWYLKKKLKARFTTRRPRTQKKSWKTNRMESKRTVQTLVKASLIKLLYSRQVCLCEFTRRCLSLIVGYRPPGLMAFFSRFLLFCKMPSKKKIIKTWMKSAFAKNEMNYKEKKNCIN